MTNGPTPNETLYGGMSRTVTFEDGATAEVFIQQLGVRAYPKYKAHLQDEPKLVELYCGKEDGWSDKLSLQSFEDIVLLGARINADFFGRWLERQEKTQAKLPKVGVEEAGQMLDDLAKRNPELLKTILQTVSPSTSPA